MGYSALTRIGVPYMAYHCKIYISPTYYVLKYWQWQCSTLIHSFTLSIPSFLGLDTELGDIRYRSLISYYHNHHKVYWDRDQDYQRRENLPSRSSLRFQQQSFYIGGLAISTDLVNKVTLTSYDRYISILVLVASKTYLGIWV